MRVFIVLAMFFVTACSSVPDANQQAINQVKSFYSFYLCAFVSNSPPPLQSPEMRRYVAADTLAQLERINQLPEPDYFNADYFTYSQDYDPAWIRALKVGPSTRNQMPLQPARWPEYPPGSVLRRKLSYGQHLGQFKI